jgi:hypothetical protein
VAQLNKQSRIDSNLTVLGRQLQDLSICSVSLITAHAALYVEIGRYPAHLLPGEDSEMHMTKVL